MTTSPRQRDVAEAKEWLGSLIGNAPFGILALDVAGYCTLVNARAAHVFDVAPEALIDLALLEVLSTWPELATALPPIGESGRVDFDRDRVRRGDRVYRVRGRVIVDGTLLTFNDITDDIRIRERQEALLTSLQAANRELADFAYICAHDMKSPVSSITGLLEALEECDELPEEAESIVDMAKRSTASLDRTVRSLNEVLAVRQTLDGTADRTSVRAVLDEALDALSGPIGEASATVRVEMDEDVGVPMQVVHLKSVLQNLVGNAIKYRDRDRLPDVVVRVADGDGAIALEIEDNGVGLDLEKVGTKLFGLFNRFHSHVDGTGIGLYLTQSIVESYGGTIDVRSAVGRGTCFRIELPLGAQDGTGEFDRDD